MLEKYIKLEAVELDVDVITPQEAIEVAGRKLFDSGRIEEEYINEMIKAYEELGPYIVLAPRIAIPHAKPGKFVKETGISFIRLKRPVVFNNIKNDPVSFIFALCGVDEHGHLDMLKALSQFLMNEEKMKKIEEITSSQEFLNIVKEEKL